MVQTKEEDMDEIDRAITVPANAKGKRENKGNKG